MADESRPIGALIASVIGAGLILVDAALLSAAGSAATQLGYTAIGGILGALATLGILFGFVILILAILVYLNPESHVGYGIAILLLSLFSLISGGGFLIGTVAGVIGGILALRFEPDYDPLPPLTGTSPLLAGPLPNSWTPARTPCPNCGSPVALGASQCPRCETPIRPTA
ncbi:MAG TPA: DUF6114 domain-containing protein [Thermoplasmata archaeon]|nr:DUF6114 domain-containing protein [Thermoplasmata archaeon]